MSDQRKRLRGDAENPLSVDEDFWIPIRPGQPPVISEEDVEHFRKRLLEALGVPPEYLKKP